MSQINIFLLDDLNSIKEEISLAKPITYKELLVQLGKSIKNLPKYYELYIIDSNSAEIKIDNEDKYKKLEDIYLLEK